ncbi:MAG: hypothetical protein JNM31_14600 [Flavobacteriales bacterium]|nr:hypothetical protein [Flavobacteriales bacterium]
MSSGYILPRLFLVASLLMSGCDKEEPIPDPTPDPQANTVVALQVLHRYGGASFDLAGTWPDAVGTSLKFTQVRYYIGSPVFQDDVGDTVQAFAGKYLLISAASNAIQVMGELHGHLHTMGFGLGVDSVLNHQDPTLAAPPLNDATMHWNWNPAQGYKFLVLEGRYDDDGTGVVDADDPEFVYHCAGDALHRNTSVEVHTDALTGGNLALTLHMDMQVLLQGVDVAASPIVMAPTGTAVTLMNNLRNAFTHP